MNNFSVPTHSIETMASRIDEEVISHGLASVSLDVQAQGNRSSISRLPADILEVIFIHCARDSQSLQSARPTPHAPRWVNVSYVCRYWRNIALNCTTLWSYLSMTSPRWTEALLARSKQAPLKLRVDLQCDSTRNLEMHFLNRGVRHLERIQELHVSLPPCSKFELDFFLSILPWHFHRLRDLTISMGSSGQHPKTLFVFLGGGTPTLHTLELAYFSMPWLSFNIGGLTRLSLSGSRFQQSMAEVLSTLKSMRYLTHLYLEDALPCDDSLQVLSTTAIHNFQKISFPCLYRLLITAPLSTVLAFLSYVDASSTTQVRLGCRHESSYSAEEYGALTSFLLQMFLNSGLVIRSLAIECAQSGKASLTFSPSLSASERDYNPSTSIQRAEWHHDVPLQVIIASNSLTQSDGNHILGEICRSLPLAQVQNVHVIHPPPLSSFLEHALGYVCDLRHLKLSQGSITTLSTIGPILSLLDCAENQGGLSVDQGSDGAFWAALERLELKGIIVLLRPTDSEVRRLFDALSARKASQGRRGRTAEEHTIRKHGPYEVLDMTWTWERDSDPVA